MPHQIDEFIKEIKKTIAALTASHADILARQLSVAFVLGYRKSGTKVGISDLQRNAIKKIAAENLGYINEFNAALGKQLEGRVKELIAEGKGYNDVKKEMRTYIQEVFGHNGAVTIDRTGQVRTIIQVDQFGNLRRVEKTISQPYSASLESYSDMLSRTATHAAYERGRAEGYQSQGIRKWRFVGPIDPPRVRPDHAAVVGRVFEYDTPESDAAMEMLAAPNCRHRAIVVFEDERLNTPDNFYQTMKEKVGLRFNTETKNGNIIKYPAHKKACLRCLILG